MSTGGLVVRKAADIHAPPAKVWEIIVSPQALKRWMLVEPVVEDGQPLHSGSKVLWKDDSGKTYLTGTVTAFEPARKLVLELDDVSWTRKARPGEVTYAFTLSQTQGGTHVAFALGDLSIDPQAQQWYDAYNASRELDVIKEMAEGS